MEAFIKVGLAFFGILVAIDTFKTAIKELP